MRRALALAARGRGLVSPNPAVGAVLLDGERIVAEGHHRRFGGPHAEAALLDQLEGGPPVRPSAVLLVTLEPCSHKGKTAPCVDRLLASPIRRFVVATSDPNPLVSGRGIRALRADGREVRVGLEEDRARGLNLPFFLAQREGRAMVTLKIASTLDGKVADRGGGSRWITSPASRALVSRLRSHADAIVIGHGTARRDDPRLVVHGDPRRTPTRILLDSRLASDPDLKLARLWRRQVAGRTGDASSPDRRGNWIQVEDRAAGPALRWRFEPRLIAVGAEPTAARIRSFRRAGWEVWLLPDRSGRRVDLARLGRAAARAGLLDLLVEGGPRLSAAFLEDGPLDRLLLFLAPRVLGPGLGWSDACPPREISASRTLVAAAPPRRIGGGDLLLDLVPGGPVRSRATG